MKAHSAVDVAKHLFLVGLTAVALLLFFFFGYLPWTTHHGETIAVPKVTGMPLREVADFLDDHSLRFFVQDSVFDPSVKPFTVLAQDPAPGAQVKEDRKISLSVAMKNPPLLAMPKLLDLSLKTATLTLTNSGLQLGTVKTVPDLQQNAVLKQLVGGQEIVPGAPVPKNAVVDLVVGDGQGNNEFDLESVVGRPFDEIKIALQGQGLQIGSVIYQPGGSGLDGTVLRQRPTAGSQVRTGQLVDLWVKGTDPNGEPAPEETQ